MINQKGQTLLEILLAFSVSILVLGAIVMVITTSLNNAQYTKNQGLANSYAKEGMAIVRKTRDSNWLNFLSKSGHYCLGSGESEITTPSCTPPNVGIFWREITITHNSDRCKADPGCTDPGCLKGSSVSVKVSWPDSKCPAGVGDPYCHNVELITCFANLDTKVTP